VLTVPCATAAHDSIGVQRHAPTSWRGTVHASSVVAMPRISAFYGVVICMYWNEKDHPVAHFHAYHAGRRASVSADGAVLAGSLEPRACNSSGNGPATPRRDPGELGPRPPERAPARHPTPALGLSA
jgi:hypothetical protein